MDSKNYKIYNKILSLQEPLRVLKHHEVAFNYQVPFLKNKTLPSLR